MGFFSTICKFFKGPEKPETSEDTQKVEAAKSAEKCEAQASSQEIPQVVEESSTIDRGEVSQSFKEETSSLNPPESSQKAIETPLERVEGEPPAKPLTPPLPERETETERDLETAQGSALDSFDSFPKEVLEERPSFAVESVGDETVVQEPLPTAATKEMPNRELNEQTEENAPTVQKSVASSPEEETMILALRSAEPKLSAWLAIVLEGVEEVSPLLYSRIAFLLRALEAPGDEIEQFLQDFKAWLEDMEYVYIEEFRSELQYRLALALELEDEEDERNRLFIKIANGLAKTRAELSRKMDDLLSAHKSLDEAFWDHLEEVFITADLGYEASIRLAGRLRERAREEHIDDPGQIKRLLREEVSAIFRIQPHITAYTAPEVVLMVGVNGVGKTTTIGKLAHRAKLQGRKVMICAADTFRAAAIEQLAVWAERAGALFYAKEQGSDPASVAYEAVEKAISTGVDLLFVDTAGRLQTKVNLMEELGKIRAVLGKKHPGAPHRTILVLDASTGQNALSQLKLFRETSGVDELILTKLDGTAKGGFAIALALEYHLPISFIGLGEKLEDLRPFNGEDFANALLEDEGEK